MVDSGTLHKCYLHGFDLDSYTVITPSHLCLGYNKWLISVQTL